MGRAAEDETCCSSAFKSQGGRHISARLRDHCVQTEQHHWWCPRCLILVIVLILNASSVQICEGSKVEHSTVGTQGGGGGCRCQLPSPSIDIKETSTSYLVTFNGSQYSRISSANMIEEKKTMRKRSVVRGYYYLGEMICR